VAYDGIHGFPEHERQAGFVPLLTGLEGVDSGYLDDVAAVKRALEQWNLHAALRATWPDDPAGALTRFQIPLPVETLTPLFDAEQGDHLRQAVMNGEDLVELPRALRRYLAFMRELLRWRDHYRQACEPSQPLMRAWWHRQLARVRAQLGPNKANAIVHAPVAFELSSGCSVGCWFCALSAPQLQTVWPYTPAHRQQWQAILRVTQEVIGPAAAQGFCYWATEPFDNPDYERFLLDFHAVLGRFPMTTTALPMRDPTRTQALIEQHRRLDPGLDRFSVLSTGIASRIHAEFSPQQLLLTELLPQNKGANPKFRKARSGRALAAKTKHDQPNRFSETPTTIACVSGFLINPCERRVQLMTPCPVSASSPQGFQILATGRFSSAEELRKLLEYMIASQMPMDPPLHAEVRLRRDLVVSSPTPSRLQFKSAFTTLTFDAVEGAAQFAALLSDGAMTAAQLAEAREQARDIPPEQSLFMIDQFRQHGLLDETVVAHSSSAHRNPDWSYHESAGG